MTTEIDPDRQKLLIEEYKEAGHLHRLHVGLMFGQITVFLGASGALLHRLLGQPPLPLIATLLFAAVGIFMAAVFLVLHERVFAYSLGARRRAQAIQLLLGLELYGYRETELPVPLLKKLHASTVTRALYIVAMGVWVVVAIAGLLDCFK